MFIFCYLGGGASPAQTANPAQTAKNKHAPVPSQRVCFFAVWAGGRVCFLLFGGSCLFFLLFGGWTFFVFAVWVRVYFLLFGRGSFFFAVWAGRHFLCLLFGRGRVYFLLFGRGSFFFFAVWAVCVFFSVWAGDGSSLTYRSAWLVFKRPNNKKDQTAKKKRAP